MPTDLLVHAGKKYGYDYEGQLLGDKARTVIFDNSKVKRLVPYFVATMRFDQAIAKIIQNILSQPELQKEDPEFEAFCDKMVEVMKEAYASF